AHRLVDDLDLAVLDEEDAARRAALVEQEVARPRFRDLGDGEQAIVLLVVEVGDELTRPGFGPPDHGHAHAPPWIGRDDSTQPRTARTARRATRHGAREARDGARPARRRWWPRPPPPPARACGRRGAAPRTSGRRPRSSAASPGPRGRRGRRPAGRAA